MTTPPVSERLLDAADACAHCAKTASPVWIANREHEPVLREAATTLASLSADNERLRKALEPLQDSLADVELKWSPEGLSDDCKISVEIECTLGDYRAALTAALNGEE